MDRILKLAAKIQQGDALIELISYIPNNLVSRQFETCTVGAFGV